MGTQHTGATDGPTETQPTTRRDRLDAAFDADAGTVTDEWAGAFIYTSWGYGQTNVNFAQIVEVSDSGKTVLARMVTANVDTRSNGTEGVLPEGDQYGESFRLHVRGSERGRRSAAATRTSTAIPNPASVSTHSSRLRRPAGRSTERRRTTGTNAGRRSTVPVSVAIFSPTSGRALTPYRVVSVDATDAQPPYAVSTVRPTRPRSEGAHDHQVRARVRSCVRALAHDIDGDCRRRLRDGARGRTKSDTNGTATVSDTFEAYEVGTNNPGPWTAPSGSSGSAVVGDSFLGDRALEVTDSDGAAIYDGATVDSNDAAVQAVIRGTNAGGYIEYGGVTLEVNTGEFTNRLRLSDGTDETIVDGAAPTAGEWANVELIADGGDLEATIWPVGTDKPNSSDIELTGVDATGDLEVSTVNTDDVLTVDEVSVQPYSTLGSQTVSGTVTDQYDEPVPNATVQAIGVTQGALGGDDLEAEADALLDELSDPLPDAFNPDADLGDQYANADGTYAAVHPAASAWNLGGVSLGSNAVSPAVTPSLDTPDVVLPADEQLIVSTWDAGDTGGALTKTASTARFPARPRPIPWSSSNSGRPARRHTRGRSTRNHSSR